MNNFILFNFRVVHNHIVIPFKLVLECKTKPVVLQFLLSLWESYFFCNFAKFQNPCWYKSTDHREENQREKSYVGSAAGQRMHAALTKISSFKILNLVRTSKQLNLWNAELWVYFYFTFQRSAEFFVNASKFQSLINGKQESTEASSFFCIIILSIHYKSDNHKIWLLISISHPEEGPLPLGDLIKERVW